MVVFNKVLVAVDGSDESKRAAGVAEELARQFGSSVVVVHVVGIFYSGAATWSPEWSPALEELLHQIVDRMKAAGLAAHVLLGDAPHGHVGKAIAELAAEQGADLVVLGSTGRSQLAGLVLGSVSSRVIHFATCPVLVVKDVGDGSPGQKA
jgi:nucleotide-binding universal stress UspA family protein